MTVTDPTGIDEIVTAARSLAPVLASNYEESERDRRLTEATVGAMTEAGMFRILTPRTHGGSEAGLRAQVDSLAAVSAVHPRPDGCSSCPTRTSG